MIAGYLAKGRCSWVSKSCAVCRPRVERLHHCEKEAQGCSTGGNNVDAGMQSANASSQGKRWGSATLRTLRALRKAWCTAAASPYQHPGASSAMRVPTNCQRPSPHGHAWWNSARKMPITTVSGARSAGSSPRLQGCSSQTSRPSNPTALGWVAPSQPGGTLSNRGSVVFAGGASCTEAGLWVLRAKRSRASYEVSMTLPGLCHGAGAKRATFSALKR